LFSAQLERVVAARGGLHQPREEVDHLEQRLVREQQIASGAGALLREDQPGGEEAREGGAVLVQRGADAALGQLAAAEGADRGEVDHGSGRPPGLPAALLLRLRHRSAFHVEPETMPAIAARSTHQRALLLEYAARPLPEA